MPYATAILEQLRPSGYTSNNVRLFCYNLYLVAKNQLENYNKVRKCLSKEELNEISF